MSKECNKDAIYRYTWPGQDEKRICEDCGAKLRGVAQAIGLHLQLILDIKDHKCTQLVK